MYYNKIKIIISLVIFIYITSCDDNDKCKYTDCPPSSTFQYTLIDTDGNNLFQSNDYEISSVTIKAFSDTEEFSIGGIIGDNVVYFEIVRNINKVEVDYGNNLKDVFTIRNINEKELECCPPLINDFEISLNNENFCTQCSDKVWEIKK